MSSKNGTPNPYPTANYFSKLTFWWLLDIFKLGKNGNLRDDNLYNVLPEHVSQTLGDNLEKAWKNELSEAKKRRRKASLWKAMLKIFGWSLFKEGFFTMLAHLCRSTQPMLLAKLILYFSPLSNSTAEDAYIYGSGLIIVTFFGSVAFRHTIYSQFLTGMRMRIACSSLLYRKLLKISSASTGSAVNGLIINIMSNDLARVQDFVKHMHFLWITPVLMTVVAYFMWQQLGIISLSGILLMLLQTLPNQIIWFRIASKLRRKIAMRSDKRVLLIGEIVNGIRVMKMYAWENCFEKVVELARKREIDVFLKLFYIRSINMAFTVMADRTALFCTIAVYVCFGNDVTADTVFAAVQYFAVLRTVSSYLLADAVAYTSATKIALKRMEAFLEREEIQPDICIQASIPKGTISMKDVDASWDASSSTNNICKASLNIVPGKLYAVIGSVGSGKSSLLKLILGELSAKIGNISLNGNLSFASQESWLFNGSVRDNILFGEEYCDEKYKKVTEVCQLSTDFEQLAFADKTLVGERGMALSGGQCARVNLARSVYRDADIYLFDDPLSAVDSHVSKRLFEQCISGYLKTKTRVLVTHQLQYLQKTDGIIVLNDGQIEFEGTYQQFIANKKYLQSLSTIEEKQQTPINDEENKHIEQSENIIEKDEKSNKPAPEETKETMSNGQSVGLLFYKYFKAGGSHLGLFLTLLSCLFTQLIISTFDYSLMYWTNQEEKKRLENLSNETTSLSESPTKNQYLSNETALTICGGLVIAAVVFSAIKNLLFFNRCLSSSRTIHNNMFSRLLRAPMYFFNTNPSGRMLNRFSKDIGTADDDVPSLMTQIIAQLLTIASVCVQIIVVKWWIAGIVLTYGFITVKINSVFLITLRTLRRLEGNAKSPVFSLVNSSLLGLSTIRSCKAENLSTRNFDKRQDVHTSSQYLCYATCVAFGVCADFLAVIFFAFLIYSLILTKGQSIMGGDVGLVITQYLSVCLTVQYVMRQMAELVSQMTSVERMLEYTKLQQEGPFETELDEKYEKNWPSKAQIQFDKLSLRYSDNEPAVLKNLEFTIEPGMKVGVVGRTGAGKSSLITALFRLANYDGSVLIDGIDTKQIGLKTLRTKISIIPQEPTLFTASLRDNLDPLAECDDASMWSALKNVEMHKHFASLDQVIDGNLSAGQRQLLCLARAILRKNKILILDEATANIDLHTDELIQKTIRSSFNDCTVLTIAHRLNTVMDCDRILVMDAGEVVEFDQACNLLENTDGCFWKIVENSGDAQTLRNIAENARNGSKIIESIDINRENQITRL